MIAVLVYLFLNSFFFGQFIIGKANFDEAHKKYPSAIGFYTTAYLYYKINHFSEDNKISYFGLPYKIAICYLKENNKAKSVWSMVEGMNSIQKQYGSYSKENAYFIRKYLIEYYLNNDKPIFAKQEFKNLLLIYKKVGYTDNEMADLIRLSADLNYQQKKYVTAISLYEQAYKASQNKQDIDYNIFSRIVNRICAYKIKIGEAKIALSLYKDSINTLKASGPKQDELTAQMLMTVGDYYSKDDKTTKEAILSYEDAVQVIKKLPNTNYLKQNLNEYLLTLKALYEKDNQTLKAREIDLEIARKRRFSFV